MDKLFETAEALLAYAKATPAAASTGEAEALQVLRELIDAWEDHCAEQRAAQERYARFELAYHGANSKRAELMRARDADQRARAVLQRMAQSLIL